MSVSGHTPGPWKAQWSKYNEGRFIVQGAAPSYRVLADFDGDGYGPDEQSIADAHLIAAAPDLLAALEATVAALSTCERSYRMGGGSEFADYLAGVIQQGVEAIDKARGETP